MLGLGLVLEFGAPFVSGIVGSNGETIIQHGERGEIMERSEVGR